MLRMDQQDLERKSVNNSIISSDFQRIYSSHGEALVVQRRQ